MVITDPKSFKASRTTNCRGQVSTITQREATASFNRNLQRAEGRMVDKMDRDHTFLLNRLVRQRLQAKGLTSPLAQFA
jgi:hypothetical protein